METRSEQEEEEEEEGPLYYYCYYYTRSLTAIYRQLLECGIPPTPAAVLAAAALSKIAIASMPKLYGCHYSLLQFWVYAATTTA